MYMKKWVIGVITFLGLIPNVIAQSSGNDIINGIGKGINWLFTAKFTFAGFEHTLGYFIAIGLVFYAVLRALVAKVKLFEDSDAMANLLSIALAVLLAFFTPFTNYFEDLIEIGGLVGLLLILILSGLAIWTTIHVSYQEGKEARSKSSAAGSVARAASETAKRQEREAKTVTKIAKKQLKSLEKIREGATKKDGGKLLREGLKGFEEELSNEGTILSNFSNLVAMAKTRLDILDRALERIPNGETTDMRKHFNAMVDIETAVKGLNTKVIALFEELRNNYVQVKEYLQNGETNEAVPLLAEMKNVITVIRADEQEIFKLENEFKSSNNKLETLIVKAGGAIP